MYKVSVNFVKLKLFIPKRSASINIIAKDEEILRTWANDYARAVQQRMFYQETKLTKTRTFFT